MLAGQLNFATFFDTFTEAPSVNATLSVSATVSVAGASAQERKALADRIAARLGATTTWRNGYYMATGMTSALPIEIRRDPPLPVEIHFNPPIFEPDVTDGTDAGEAA